MSKQVLSIVLLGVGVLAAAPQENKPAAAAAKVAPAPAGKELNRAELDALLAHPEKIFVLDLRGADEIAKIGSLPGYVNIPIAQLESRLSEVPRDKIILPVSNHSVRAWKAQAILEKTATRFPAASAFRTTKKRAESSSFPPKQTSKASLPETI